MSGTGPDDVWVVGSLGGILHWDGSSWTVVPSGTTRDLHAVVAVDRSTAFAVGSGVALRWDGTTWRQDPGMNSAVLDSVWATGPTDALAVGRPATLMRWDGTSWTPLSIPGDFIPTSVWGVEPGVSWVTATTTLNVLGRRGWLLEQDGAGFVRTIVGDDVVVNHLTGRSADRLWGTLVTGTPDGTETLAVARRVGDDWLAATTLASPAPTPLGLYAIDDDTLWFVGSRQGGTEAVIGRLSRD